MDPFNPLEPSPRDPLYLAFEAELLSALGEDCILQDFADAAFEYSKHTDQGVVIKMTKMWRRSTLMAKPRLQGPDAFIASYRSYMNGSLNGIPPHILQRGPA